jgi:hypothetical protein
VQNANANDWAQASVAGIVNGKQVSSVVRRTGDREGRQSELGGRPDQDTARGEVHRAVVDGERHCRPAEKAKHGTMKIGSSYVI